MRVRLISLITFLSVYSSAQKTNDSLDFGVGITTYIFSNTSPGNKIVFAYGPSIFLNFNSKFNFQLGLLFDPNKYKYPTTSKYPYDSVAYSRTYLPFLLHYNFLIVNKLDIFLKAGIFLNYNYTKKSNSINVNFYYGVGLAYTFFHRLNFRVCPNVTFRKGYLASGLLFDFSYFISTKKIWQVRKVIIEE